MKRNISIITNFGCHTDCWYCVWKTHPLKNVSLETDWIKLEQFLFDHKDLSKVSISGGGDCLYKYEDMYKPWWDKLFSICNKLNMKIDVHSREVFYNEDFWNKINRCVLSSDNLNDDITYFDWLKTHVKMRIVHVITKETTQSMVEQYIDYCNKNEMQLTFKCLVGYDDAGNYEKYKKIYNNQFFLDAGDYNIYYMPNNEISEVFLYG